MARVTRDSTPQRRSARLKSNPSESARKSQLSKIQLNSVLERDETPETAEQSSIDNVVSTPITERKLQRQLEELSKISTPKTEPKPAKEQMHPATVHHTTAKAPDSGMKLGFADINTARASVASLQNTPTRRRQSIATTNISPTFQFEFRRDAAMSQEGQKLMESVRADAARIKAQMLAEKELQTQKESRSNTTFVDATGRKIARPTSKAGRFSDVHMAEFKKMDSIANHPSSFRARPGYANSTTQSLKRSSSRANLDELERPRTAGKSPSTRIPPPITGRLGSTSPFKTIPSSIPRQESGISVKRMRREDDTDVSANKPTIIPRPMASSLLSPTKASAARMTLATTSFTRIQGLSRSNSVKSVRSIHRNAAPISFSPEKTVQVSMNVDKPLPRIPIDDSPRNAPQILVPSSPVKTISSPAKGPSERTSKLPTLSGLRSILRSPHKKPASPRPDTPKRLNNAIVAPGSAKKVDFTPSVKSRYAVKLAEGSPSPAKLDRSRSTSTFAPAIPYDPSAFVVQYDDDDWENETRDIVYPTLPTATIASTDHAFSQKAKDHNRRESKEFKSIFTTLHPRPEPGLSLTNVNTDLNRTNPEVHASRVLSPAKQVVVPRSPTIRKVRTSEPVQPFEDRIQTVPHGLSGKKRRIESSIEDEKYGTDEDAKENRRITHHPDIPGAWDDTSEDQDEGDKRGGKRAKIHQPDERMQISVSPAKKPSAAREAAVKNAKDRKSKVSLGGRGVLSLSRLNMLARPKQRG